MVYYAIMKSKADMLMELSQVNFAIQEYKKLKDLLQGKKMFKLMMKIYEQLSVCYTDSGMYQIALSYLKKAL